MQHRLFVDANNERNREGEMVERSMIEKIWKLKEWLRILGEANEVEEKP